ncbi:MAG: metal-dependent hydrolase [Chthoniobacterales bacterium]
MKFIYYGHSCFGLEIDGKHFLFDPYITLNELAANIDTTSIPADYILISHGHVDHTADAQSIAERTGAPIISNWEIIDWFGKQGIQNGHPMNLGGSWIFDFVFVKSTPALHSSSLPDGSYGGNPGGFVLKTPSETIYYSGDTALTRDMELIGEEFTIDTAILPVGDNFTMGAKDAAKAAKLVGTKQVIGVHFDTFPYIKIDHAAAVQIFEDAGIKLILPKIGESLSLSKNSL